MLPLLLHRPLLCFYPPGACSSRCYDRDGLFQTDHSFFSHAMGVSFLQPFFLAVSAVVRVSFVREKKPPTADEDDHEGNGLSCFVVLSMLERAPLGCFLRTVSFVAVHTPIPREVVTTVLLFHRRLDGYHTRKRRALL